MKFAHLIDQKRHEPLPGDGAVVLLGAGPLSTHPLFADCTQRSGEDRAMWVERIRQIYLSGALFGDMWPLDRGQP